MADNNNLEFWQRGAVRDVPPLLQPVAHALLQVSEDAGRYTEDFPAALLWEKPGGVASVGFHLKHIRGVIDRLFTYSRGEGLSADQLKELADEQQVSDPDVTPSELVSKLRAQADKAITQLRFTTESSLTEPRELGRKKIPTTVLGLLFHAAEHSQRHIGQMLVTARILQGASVKR